MSEAQSCTERGSKALIAATAQCASFTDSFVARRRFRHLRTTYSSYAMPSRSNFDAVSGQPTADHRRFDTVGNGHCCISANIKDPGLLLAVRGSSLACLWGRTSVGTGLMG